MTPNIEPRPEETSFTLPHRTQKPQKSNAPDPKKLRRGLPSLLRLWLAQVPSPLWVGIRNSAMTPNIQPRLEETSFTLPHRTPKNWRRDLPSSGRLWVAQVPSSLWVGICNSAMTPNIEPRLEETSFTLPHRTQNHQKTTAPNPKKLAQGSAQPSQTMGSPGTLPLWVNIRNSAMTPNIEPRLKETSFTLPHRTPKNLRRGLPSPVRLWLAQVPPLMGRHM